MTTPQPETRAIEDDLPAPWIRQYDPEYKTFFYINPTTQPPTTSWTRPGMPEGEIHPEQAHAINLSQHLESKPGQEGQGQAEGVDMMNASSTAAPVPSLPPPGAGVGGEDESTGEGDRGLGSMVAGMVMGKHSSSGSNQGYSGQQSYAQQQQYGYSQQYPQQQQGYSQYPQYQTQSYQAPPQQSSSSGMGMGSGLAMGGVGGALGGFLLGEMMGGNNRRSSGMFSHNMGAPPFMGGGMAGMGGLGSMFSGNGGGMFSGNGGGMFSQGMGNFGQGMGGYGGGGGRHHGGHHGGGGW